MFYIRADGNEQIGSGHIMRCLSIANALKKKGIAATFITADSASQELVASFGFPVICLDTDWRDWSQEIDKMAKLIKSLKIEKVLIDSYSVTRTYFQQLRNYTKIIYMDDINQFVYPVDILVNYNIYAQKMVSKEDYASENTRLLLGCNYVPLREEFRNMRKPARKKVSDILITTGGSDSYNFAGTLLRSLVTKQYENYSFHVVAGYYNTHKEELRQLAQKHSNIVLHNQVRQMSKLMQECDIAVTAGGSTLYELSACGVPSISFSFADNQLYGVKEFDEQEIVYYSGDIRHNLRECLDNIAGRLNLLIMDEALRIRLASRMQALVDGFGAERIANEIIKL